MSLSLSWPRDPNRQRQRRSVALQFPDSLALVFLFVRLFLFVRRTVRRARGSTIDSSPRGQSRPEGERRLLPTLRPPRRSRTQPTRSPPKPHGDLPTRTLAAFTSQTSTISDDAACVHVHRPGDRGRERTRGLHEATGGRRPQGERFVWAKRVRHVAAWARAAAGVHGAAPSPVTGGRRQRAQLRTARRKLQRTEASRRAGTTGVLDVFRPVGRKRGQNRCQRSGYVVWSS